MAMESLQSRSIRPCVSTSIKRRFFRTALESRQRIKRLGDYQLLRLDEMLLNWSCQNPLNRDPGTTYIN